MNLEIEATFLEIDKAELRAKLEAIGAQLVPKFLCAASFSTLVNTLSRASATRATESC